MQTSTLVGIIVAVLVIAGLGWWVYGMQGGALAPVAQEEQDIAPGTNEENVVPPPGAPLSATVAYSASGFSPGTVTIKKGGTVTWTSSSATLWVASAQHPTHAVYSGTALAEHCGGAAANTSFDQCAAGSSYSFTFNKVGSWAYHNHSNASHFGRVEVVE